jgi:hypothetical protein
VLSSDPSSRGSGSRFDDDRSHDSPRSSSFMPSPHGTTGLSHYLAHDDVPEATDGDDISIHTTEEMEKYKSLHHREFAHTCVYDVNHLLTLEFLMTFEIVERSRKLFMKFHLFRKSFGCDFSHLSELLDFSKSCLLESSAMRNFNKVEFSDAISGKSARLRFSDIHNPSLRFLHRWMSSMLFPMMELHSVTTPELKCLFAMVKRIKYTLVADIVDYFKMCIKCWDPLSVPPWSLRLP